MVYHNESRYKESAWTRLGGRLQALFKGDRLEKSCGFAVASWGYKKSPLKLLSEVGLIKKAGFTGYRAHVVPVRQQRFGTLQAHLRLIGMGRQANRLAEDASEMKGTHFHHPGQFLQRHLAV